MASRFSADAFWLFAARNRPCSPALPNGLQRRSPIQFRSGATNLFSELGGCPPAIAGHRGGDLDLTRTVTGLPHRRRGRDRQSSGR